MRRVTILKTAVCVVACLGLNAPTLAVPYPTTVPQYDNVRRGLALEKEGRIEEAREAYREAIEANSENVAARILLAKSLAESKDLQDLKEAMTQLVQALTIRPDIAEGWLLAGNAASRMLLERETFDEESGDARNTAVFDELLGHFVAGLSSVPGLGGGNQQSLVEKLRSRWEEVPDSIEVNELLFNTAKMLYQRSLALEPGNVETLTAIASFFWDLSAIAPERRVSYTQAALEAARDAIKASPYDYRALLLCARAYQRRAYAVEVDDGTQEGLEEKMSLLASAEESYKQALLLGPPSRSAINDLAKVYADQDKIDEGVDYFRELGEAADDEGVRLQAMRAIAHLYEGADHIRKAEEQWLKMIEAYPARLDAYLLLARLYVDNGHTDKALELLAGAVEKHPKFLDGHEMLGRLHYKAGRMAEAEKHFLAAIRLHDAGWFESAESEEEQQTQAGVVPAFHSALMSLSNIYISRNQHLKAGDIIDDYRSVYFETNSRGNLITDSQRRLIPREPVELVAQAMLQAGTAYYGAHRFSEAIRCLSIAARVKNGRYYEAQSMLARAYEAIVALKAFSADEKLQAVISAGRVWQDVLKYLPDDPNARYQLARLMVATSKRDLDQVEAFKAGKANETDAARAISMLNDMLKEHPNNIPALYLRADSYEFLGETAKALQDAEALMAVKPDEALSPVKGDVQPINEDVLNALRSRALTLMARIHVDAIPDLDKAEELATEALQAMPRSPFVLDTLARIEYKKAMAQQDPAARKQILLKALGRVRQAVTWRPTPSSRYHYAQIILALNGDSKTRAVAIRHLQKALSENRAFREADDAEALLRKLKSQ